MKMMEQLTKRDGSGKLTQAGWAFNHYYSQEWLWATLVYQQGGWLWSEDGTKALWNEEPGVQAVEALLADGGVTDPVRAGQLADELLEAQRQYLPNFFSA